MKRKITLLVAVIAVLAIGLLGYQYLSTNKWSDQAHARDNAELFLKYLYAPGKSKEAGNLASAELAATKTEADLTVPSDAKQTIKSITYDTENKSSEDMYIFSGSMTSNLGDTSQEVKNTFSVRMIRETAKGDWKVDAYTVD